MAKYALLRRTIASLALLTNPFLAAQQSDAPSQSPLAAPVSTTKTHSIVITAIKKKASESVLIPTDFEVKEDGNPATITEVQKLGRLPLHYCVVFDTNNSVADSFKFREREATILLSKAVNPATDRGWLVISGTAVLESPETADPQSIIGSITQQIPGTSSSVYDAMEGCLLRMLKANTEQEFRAMLLFTEGENKPGHFAPTEVLDTALRSRTHIYVFSKMHDAMQSNDLFPSGSNWTNVPGPSVLGKLVLNLPGLDSPFTGGRMFESATNKQMESAIDQLSEDLQNLILVSYRPAGVAPDDHRHNIEVKPRVKGLSILAPMQYVPPAIAQ